MGSVAVIGLPDEKWGESLVAFVVAVLVPITFYNAMMGRFATHRRFARVTMPAWLFVAVSGLVVYVMAVHLYPTAGS